MSVLKYDKLDHVVRITLNRPKQLNALNRVMADDLVEAIGTYQKDDDAWVAIIMGSGEKAFCVGADLKDEAHMNKPEEWEAEFVRQLVSVKKPLIAAINGYCLGAGFAISMACDIRVASESATFSTPDQKLNLIDCFAALMLSRMIPWAPAMEIILTGEMISATEAHCIGLVNRVVPAEKLMDSVDWFAEKICRNGPLALKACKELNWRAYSLPIEESLELFKQVARDVLASEDTQEGLLAFFEKRAPQWKCR